MSVPTGSAIGPNRSGDTAPRFFSSHFRASLMSGTVRPTWSRPRSPGIPTSMAFAPMSCALQSLRFAVFSYAIPFG